MPRTVFFKRTVLSTAGSLLVESDSKRVGITIINRSLAANPIYVSFDKGLTNAGWPYTNTLTLNLNDAVTLLKTDGDDCTKEVWAIGFAVGYVDIIETTEG